MEVAGLRDSGLPGTSEAADSGPAGRRGGCWASGRGPVPASLRAGSTGRRAWGEELVGWTKLGNWASTGEGQGHHHLAPPLAVHAVGTRLKRPLGLPSVLLSTTGCRGPCVCLGRRAQRPCRSPSVPCPRLCLPRPRPGSELLGLQFGPGVGRGLLPVWVCAVGGARGSQEATPRRNPLCRCAWRKRLGLRAAASVPWPPCRGHGKVVSLPLHPLSPQSSCLLAPWRPLGWARPFSCVPECPEWPSQLTFPGSSFAQSPHRPSVPCGPLTASSSVFQP